MTAAYHGGLDSLVCGLSAAELAELTRLSERFRMYRIFSEVQARRGIRYVAYRTATGVQPHTIITDDLAELRHELERAALTD